MIQRECSLRGSVKVLHSSGIQMFRDFWGVSQSFVGLGIGDVEGGHRIWASGFHFLYWVGLEEPVEVEQETFGFEAVHLSLSRVEKHCNGHRILAPSPFQVILFKLGEQAVTVEDWLQIHMPCFSPL